MKRPELSDRFASYVGETLHSDDLSYEEMGNTLLTLAEDYYQMGEPDPKTIEVKILGEDYGKETITNGMEGDSGSSKEF
jgi:hypothetical protein